MLLKKVKINKYKSYSKPQEFAVEDGITRIVGKNESGKTAILEALFKFNYLNDKPEFKYNAEFDYPRNEIKEYNSLHKRENKSVVALTCTYTIDKKIVGEIEKEFGKGIVSKPTLVLSKNFDNQFILDELNLDFSAFTKCINDKFKFNESLSKELLDSATFDELLTACSNHPEEFKEIQTKLESINTSTLGMPILSDNPLAKYIYNKYIRDHLPKFWYFDDYYSLPSKIELSSIKNNNRGELTQEEFETIKALIELTDLDIPNLDENNYEAFRVAIESTSNIITDEMLTYWSTNKDLEIRIEPENPTSGKRYLNIRIYNKAYRLTLPLKNRSKGFLWFFSFLVWFNRLQGKNGSTYIVLLDEPGLNLHASAQEDLLKFIEERLAPYHQVLYTTHSPFMIDSTKLNEVRTVYDSSDRHIGSTISDALTEKDSGTLFPLQAALGYNLAQTLFVSPKNLLVEGVSDLLFLKTISEELKVKDKVGLADDITIVPVGGLDKVATFISLLHGQELQIACLLDTPDKKGTTQKLNDLIIHKIITDKSIKYCDQYADLSINKADMEDIFTKNDYLSLFNAAFTNKYPEIKMSDIVGCDMPIIPQINKIIADERFDHYLPARTLLCALDKKPYLSEATLTKFSQVFEDINQLFS